MVLITKKSRDSQHITDITDLGGKQEIMVEISSKTFNNKKIQNSYYNSLQPFAQFCNTFDNKKSEKFLETYSPFYMLNFAILFITKIQTKSYNGLDPSTIYMLYSAILLIKKVQKKSYSRSRMVRLY